VTEGWNELESMVDEENLVESAARIGCAPVRMWYIVAERDYRTNEAVRPVSFSESFYRDFGKRKEKKRRSFCLKSWAECESLVEGELGQAQVKLWQESPGLGTNKYKQP
jgi:hypothetical protein